MSIYPKTLNSAKALQREQEKLRKQATTIEDETYRLFDDLSLDWFVPRADKSEAGGKESLFSIQGITTMLPGIGKWVPGSLKENVGHLAKKAGLEFIGGYLKWKALELTYKGVRHYLKRNKDATNAS